MNIKKENVIEEYQKMIVNSWTYAKMSQQEKNTFLNLLQDHRVTDTVKGDSKTRWNILQAIYATYLQAIGYNGYNWRSEENQPF